MDKDRSKENCGFYPTNEEVYQFGPICDAGSEITIRPCTKKDEEICEYAKELKKRGVINATTKPN